MRDVAIFAIGALAGVVFARYLIAPSDCCVRVAAGVREKVGTELGATAQAAGDLFGVWGYTPGLLTALGVAP